MEITVDTLDPQPYLLVSLAIALCIALTFVGTALRNGFEGKSLVYAILSMIVGGAIPLVIGGALGYNLASNEQQRITAELSNGVSAQLQLGKDFESLIAWPFSVYRSSAPLAISYEDDGAIQKAFLVAERIDSKDGSQRFELLLQPSSGADPVELTAKSLSEAAQ